MFDQVTIRVADLCASEAFYRSQLEVLGIERSREDADSRRWEDFSIVAGNDRHPPTRNLHIAFGARSREQVDAFWRAGVDAGYDSDGEPGERPRYKPDYYGAFLRDPDGNSTEAVHHDNVRRGGHIDHLWIRVRSLDAAAAFYATIAPHTGLRTGASWDVGRQFLGGWASFSLIDDGAPLTENLQVAFPAFDRQTVQDFHLAATSAGYRYEWAPHEQQRSGVPYYVATVIDPDGTIVESVYHERS